MSTPKREINANNVAEELAAGNKAALAYIYDSYSGTLYGVLLKMVKDQELCRDLLQESFVKIWRHAASFDPSKASLYTWMLNITRNNAIDHLRSKSFRNSQKNQDIDGFVYNLEGTKQFNPQHIGLNELVKKLPEDQQQIVHLSFFKGYTQREISDEFDIPLGTVKSRGRAALQQLKKLFKR